MQANPTFLSYHTENAHAKLFETKKTIIFRKKSVDLLSSSNKFESTNRKKKM